jgi:hypothetical protein
MRKLRTKGSELSPLFFIRIQPVKQSLSGKRSFKNSILERFEPAILDHRADFKIGMGGGRQKKPHNNIIPGTLAINPEEIRRDYIHLAISSVISHVARVLIEGAELRASTLRNDISSTVYSHDVT